uniref:Uncharacterized protein n=1 Tax=Oryza barthii TaxID=65489 RepID=A0A0D3EL19_9ORYZ
MPVRCNGSEMTRLRKDFERGSAETGNVGEARRPEPGGETRERDKKGGERVAEPSGMPETRRKSRASNYAKIVP